MSKLTRTRLKQIIEAIEKGCTYKLAASASGISESTLYNWLWQAKQPKATPLKKELLESIKKAESKRAQTLLETIVEHSNKDWKAAAFLLERRYNYKKDSIHEIPEPRKEVEVLFTPLQLLRKQAADIQIAMNQASTNQSWQAYAALQRQLISVITQLSVEEKANQQNTSEGYTDEQLLTMIEDIVLTLPPIYSQRLKNTIGLIK
jgi:transposase-like protein